MAVAGPHPAVMTARRQPAATLIQKRLVICRLYIRGLCMATLLNPRSRKIMKNVTRGAIIPIIPKSAGTRRRPSTAVEASWRSIFALCPMSVTALPFPIKPRGICAPFMELSQWPEPTPQRLPGSERSGFDAAVPGRHRMAGEEFGSSIPISGCEYRGASAANAAAGTWRPRPVQDSRFEREGQFVKAGFNLVHWHELGSG